ncbi:FAD-binding domain-containing protein [Microthyrium microscopicum]|uniref:FAD-binding domain-containing protein n=1 Tax=Microthyrium microscopicum TaxID=703497 RepID=A0A6A6TWD6_9PEZI|nr:FAD-binding domain-containing protein [Microthyrium microscopicum]
MAQLHIKLKFATMKETSSLSLSVFVLLLTLINSVAAVAGTAGKNYPDSPNYPNATKWDELSKSIGGRLVKCPALAWACSSGVAYAITAESAKDIQAGMKFAHEHNLRVSVVNTGHDFLGRNKGTGSLLIRTEKLKGVQWVPEWIPTVVNTTGTKMYVAPQPAVIIQAGMMWQEVIPEVIKHNHIVVSGAEKTVGASGGWTMGGGHGAFSNKYGMGADNVLEFTVVTPSGETVIANTNSHPDLFWALRGGGGGTYGIVTSTVMKTYPKPSMYGINLDISAAANSTRDQLLDALAYYWAMTPNMTDWGLGGFPTVRYGSTYPGRLYAPGKTRSEIDAFWAPIAQKMIKLGASVSTKTSEKEFDQWLEPISPVVNLPLPFVGNMLASRLLSRSKLNEANIPAIRTMLDKLLSYTNMVLPYAVGGGQVAANRDLDIGLNPAWRDALMHLVVIGIDPKGAIEAMEPLSVDSAAYWGEANVAEKGWKRTFFGPDAHYEKLLAVKRKYDPKNLLWCSPCVGMDMLEERADGKLYTVV